MREETAIIIGAGPAGLTAAFELLTRTKIRPVVLEATDILGGISRTVNYRGNRIDIGGHRFFSKSDRVMNWWTSIMPVEATLDGTHRLAYHNQERILAAAERDEPEENMRDLVMLIRRRRSRIF